MEHDIHEYALCWLYSAHTRMIVTQSRGGAFPLPKHPRDTCSGVYGRLTSLPVLRSRGLRCGCGPHVAPGDRAHFSRRPRGGGVAAIPGEGVRGTGEGRGLWVANLALQAPTPKFKEVQRHAMRHQAKQTTMKQCTCVRINGGSHSTAIRHRVSNAGSWPLHARVLRIAWL